MSSDCMMGNQNIHIENPSNSIHTQQLRLFVGTWNVGGRAPTRETRESMHEWLLGSPPQLGRVDENHEQPSADIYVIGFQEIVPLNAGNVLGINLKDGNYAGRIASNKWDALISATLNANSTSSIRRTASDSIYFANSIGTPNLVHAVSAPIFDEDADDENHCVTLLYNRHRSDIHAKSHPCDGGCMPDSANTQSRYDGDEGIQLHYLHVDGSNTKTPNLCECNKFHDQNGRDDNDNSGDNSFLNHAKTDKEDDHNHQNIQYMAQCRAYATVPHTPPFTEQNSASPSSSSDRAVMYLTPTSTTDMVAFDDNMEPDLEFSTSTDRHMYISVARKHMVGLFISVWVRRHLRHHVKAVQVSSVGCGIMNRLGNKGSVSVSLSVHDTRFCFICTHLRSGDKPGDASRRNSDIDSILQRTRFHCSERPHSKIASLLPKTILAHDRIVWLGDLNYRLTLSTNELHNFLTQEDWKALIETDELGRERTIGGVFEGWHEGTICFAPTYKYRVNSNIYAMVDAKDGSKKHTPAWCDRILWHGKGLKQLSYTRCESKHSDHRPVRSFFIVEVESLESPSRLTTHHLASQSIEPFLVDVKELLSSTNLNVNRVVLSKHKSHT